MIDRRTRIGEIPLRLIHGGSERGTILVYHGFGAESAAQTKELLSLAGAGFLAVGVDAVGHGARRFSDFEARFGGGEGRREDPFLEVVTRTAAEVPSLIDALIETEGASPDRIGIVGISMGGYIAYAAALSETRISAMTPVLASPEWPGSFAESPHRHLDRFPPIALLSQTAALDDNVPPEGARRFHERLEPRYASHPDRLRYLEFPNCRHFMPDAEWTRLWANVVHWHQRFLGNPPATPFPTNQEPQ
ncbi:MAG: hypothetical protein CME06_14290 [Gemmatimonadetes bacterium]|nr:hypothetical protein [Gemmatimonadota bacterium]